MRFIARTMLAAGLLIALFATASSAETWPRFRGPNGSGIGTAKEMPATWTEDDYLWRVDLPKMGFSSPVVWNDRVYVTSGLEDDGTQVVQSRDTRDGRLVWARRFEAEAFKKHRLNSYATSTPALDEKHIYVTWGGPGGSTAVALDRITGEDVWRYEMGPFVAMHQFGASPMLFDDLLIVLNDQDARRELLALNRDTGELVWRLEEETKVEEEATYSTYATPCLFQPDQGPCQLIVGRSELGVSSYEPRTGKLNWQLELFKFRSVGSPILADGRVVAICGTSGVGRRAVAIRPGVVEKGIEPEVLYDVERYLPYVPTPLVHDNLLFLFADPGVISCVDVATGKELWHERVKKAKFYGSPVFAGGNIYCMTDGGEMIVLAAAREYKPLGRFELGEKTMSTPAVADGVMYLRTYSRLMAIGPKK